MNTLESVVINQYLPGDIYYVKDIKKYWIVTERHGNILCGYKSNDSNFSSYPSFMVNNIKIGWRNNLNYRVLPSGKLGGTSSIPYEDSNFVFVRKANKASLTKFMNKMKAMEIEQ